MILKIEGGILQVLELEVLEMKKKDIFQSKIVALQSRSSPHCLLFRVSSPFTGRFPSKLYAQKAL